MITGSSENQADENTFQTNVRVEGLESPAKNFYNM